MNKKQGKQTMAKKTKGCFTKHTKSSAVLVSLGGSHGADCGGIVAYDSHRSFVLVPNIVQANSANVTKVEQWTKPLNVVRQGLGSEGMISIGSALETK